MVLDVLLVTKVCLRAFKEIVAVPHIAEALADFCEKFPVLH